MDNQQALTRFEIGWICGFFDGEGYVGMNIINNYSAKKINSKRNTVMIPRLIASNTDYVAIKYFQELLQKAGVGVHIFKGRRNNPKHNPCYRATIHGYKRVTKALPIFLSGCLIKKPSLVVLAKWVEHRKKQYQYSLKDYEFYQEFMKTSGKSPNDSTLRRLYDSCTATIYKPRLSMA